jgi:uncharacterized protein YegL
MRFLFAILILGLLAPVAISQEIVDNVVVVLDDSGSMNERMRSNRKTTKMEAAKEALTTVVEQLPANAHIGIYMLNDGWLVRLGPVDKAQVVDAISKTHANGGTPLGYSMKEGADALLMKREKDHYGSYKVLIVTDGEAGDNYLVNKYLPDILARGITVDVIGVDMAGSHSLATQVHTYRKADDPESLEAAVKQVFAETSGDSDSSEEDFELAAAFPEDMAMQVIASLTDSGNHPIGETPKVIVREDGTVETQQQQPAKGGGMPVGAILLIVVVALVCLIGVLAAAAR